MALVVGSGSVLCGSRFLDERNESQAAVSEQILHEIVCPGQRVIWLHKPIPKRKPMFRVRGLVLRIGEHRILIEVERMSGERVRKWVSLQSLEV